VPAKAETTTTAGTQETPTATITLATAESAARKRATGISKATSKGTLATSGMLAAVGTTALKATLPIRR
jgi:hypothetical protein